MATRELRVYLDGTSAGTVAQAAQGALSFTYDDNYAGQPASTPCPEFFAHE